MNEIGRLILLLAVAGGGLTALGGVSIWFLDEDRRVRRSLKSMLKGEPSAALVASRRGRGIGFNFPAGTIAITWDAGVWCLTYRVEELRGVQLIVDDEVADRAFRGETRRDIDRFAAAEKRVRLRFVFDDPAWPDFVLDLWLPQDVARRNSLTASEAVQEGAHWVSRIEALLARPAPQRLAPIV